VFFARFLRLMTSQTMMPMSIQTGLKMPSQTRIFSSTLPNPASPSQASPAAVPMLHPGLTVM
jgi:hypothetical protein